MEGVIPPLRTASPKHDGCIYSTPAFQDEIMSSPPLKKGFVSM